MFYVAVQEMLSSQAQAITCYNTRYYLGRTKLEKEGLGRVANGKRTEDHISNVCVLQKIHKIEYTYIDVRI